MLTIDIRKLELPRTVDVEQCEDESGNGGAYVGELLEGNG